MIFIFGVIYREPFYGNIGLKEIELNMFCPLKSFVRRNFARNFYTGISVYKGQILGDQ